MKYLLLALLLIPSLGWAYDSKLPTGLSGPGGDFGEFINKNLEPTYTASNLTVSRCLSQTQNPVPREIISDYESQEIYQECLSADRDINTLDENGYPNNRMCLNGVCRESWD